MKKNCVYCKSEFEQLSNKGSEQLYCSRLCRSRSANERFKNKLINNGKENMQREVETNIQRGVENDKQSISGFEPFSRDNSQEDRTSKFEQKRNYSGIDINIIDCIKEKYASDVSNIFFKLKCEQLEKENAELKQDIIQLEMELDELSMEESSSTEGSILSGIMTEFKKDPQSTVSFASELIANFMKPKKAKENA